MDCSLPGSSVRGISPAGIEGILSLLQGIFTTQESNPCLLRLLHWQAGSSINLGSLYTAQQKLTNKDMGAKG